MGGCQGSELAGHLLYGTLLGHLSPSLSPQGPDRPSCSPLGPASVRGCVSTTFPRSKESHLISVSVFRAEILG